jgi:hypothetical protein
MEFLCMSLPELQSSDGQAGLLSPWDIRHGEHYTPGWHGQGGLTTFYKPISGMTQSTVTRDIPEEAIAFSSQLSMVRSG